MAWLFGDGFDFYNAAADVVLPGTPWSSVNSVSPLVSTTTRFSSGISFQLSNTVVLASNTFANSTTIWANFALFPNTAFAAGSTLWWGFDMRDGTSLQCGVYVRMDGKVVVTSTAGTVIATSPFTLSSSIWTHFQFKIVINNTTGSVECRLNGNPSNDWTATGLNTRNGTATNQTNNIFFRSANSFSLLDDVYVFNDQTAAPQDWQGDVRAVQQMPTSDSSVTWSHSTGTTNFGVVDEPRQNSDTDYVSTTTINNVDAYGVTALATTPNSIIAVQTKMIARMDDVGPHTVKSRLTSVAANADSSNLSLSTNYQWISQVNTVDPNTSTTWTAANLAAVKIGPFDVL